MYRIGIDVGGTFTDLVAIDDGGATTLAKVPSTPEDPSLGVLDGLAQLAERARPRPRARCWRRPTASCTARRSRPTRCSSARAPGRAADHRGPSRRHRDARGAQGRPLQSAHAAARAAGAAPAAPRGARADARRRPDRDAARPGLARRARSRCCSASRSRRSRSATCTPGATRATSAPPARRCSRALPGAYVSLSSRGPAADQGVRAGLDDDRQRLCRPGAVALSGAARAAARRGRLSRADPDHPVAWRGGADRRSRAGSPPARCCRGRPAGSPAASMPRACSAKAT